MAEVQKSPVGTLGKDLNAVLSQSEAQRVVGSLHKCIEKLQLLSILSYEGIETGEEGGGGADGSSGVGTILDSQRKMELRYGELLQATAAVKGNPLDPSLDLTCFASIDNKEQRKHHEELQKVSKDLKEYSRDLCRQLKENPNDTNNWNKVVTGRTELVSLLHACSKELHSSATTGKKAAVQEESNGFIDDAASQTESQRSGRSNMIQGAQATYENFAVKYVL